MAGFQNVFGEESGEVVREQTLCGRPVGSGSELRQNPELVGFRLERSPPGSVTEQAVAP